jgi:hypothetical protein
VPTITPFFVSAGDRVQSLRSPPDGAGEGRPRKRTRLQTALKPPSACRLSGSPRRNQHHELGAWSACNPVHASAALLPYLCSVRGGRRLKSVAPTPVQRQSLSSATTGIPVRYGPIGGVPKARCGHRPATRQISAEPTL